MSHSIVSLDLGTTTVKAMLFSDDGTILGSSSQEVSVLFPGEKQVEQNPAAWYETACDVIHAAVSAAQVDPKDVLAIGFSSQGISLLPVDQNLRPLRNAISWLDLRAEQECEQIREAFGEEKIFSITGKPIHAAYTLPKLLWLKRHEPDVYANTAYFLTPMDYTVARLTGNVVTEHTMAAGTMMYDLHSGNWSKEILSHFHLRTEQLPPIQWSAYQAGTLSPQAAKRCGLTTSTVVTLGAQDQKASAYGADLSSHNATCSMGTAGAFEFLLEKPVLTGKDILPVFPYVKPERWVMEGCIDTAGASIKWLKNTIFPNISYDAMNALASQASPGACGVQFYPYLTSPGTPHRNKSCRSGFLSISLATEQADLVRSLYEGLGYEVRLNIEAANRLGAKVEALSIFGGGSKSSIFCDIIASICGLPVRSFRCPEFGNIGAARLALSGMGLSDAAFSQKHLEACTDHLPDLRLKEGYEESYHRYCDFLRIQDR